MNLVSRRRVAWLLASLLASWAGLAYAADSVPDRPAEPSLRHLACLHSSTPTSLKIAAPDEGPARLLRARLSFKPGESEPAVEWLWKGDEAAAAQLEPLLRDYRMPCLEADEPAQAILQEFWLTPGTGQLEAGEAWPTSAPGSGQSSCYDGPDSPPVMSQSTGEASTVLVFFRFPKDGGEPEVEVAHHTGSSAFADVVRRYVRRYKPCSGGRTTSAWHQQVFSSSPGAGARPQFGPFELRRFLGGVKGAAQLRAHFDLNTMHCPFKVRLTMYQPALRNSAMSEGEQDPNRSAFLGWLARLQVNLPAPAESTLFGETLTINVPCLVLNLSPAAVPHA